MDIVLDSVLQVLLPVIVAGLAFYAVTRASRKRGPLWWLAVTALAVVAAPLVLLALAFGGPLGILGLALEFAPFILLPLGVWAFLNWFVKPIGALFDGGSEEPDAAPFYYLAEACRRKGDFDEAIERTQDQLEKFPDDYRGLMLLAEIQAENLKDIPAAKATIDQILNTPNQSPQNIAFALGRLADWHLSNEHDAPLARAALFRVMELLPETEFATAASERLRQLDS